MSQEEWGSKHSAGLLAWISILSSISAVGVGFGLFWGLLFTAALTAVASLLLVKRT